MAENIPLQQRVGRNIGIEVLPPYILGAAMPEIEVNPTGVTVLMEGQDKVLRTPSVRVIDGYFGVVFNTSGNTYLFEIFFVDNENNEMKIGEIPVPTIDEGVPLSLDDPFAAGLFLGLCLGEKIIMRGSLVEEPV